MAAIQPTDLFAGYEYKAAAAAVTADSIVIPLSALPGLTAAEAHATTGDGREVARQIDAAITAAYLALTEGERPTQMVASSSTSQVSNTLREVTYTRSYNLAVNNSALPIAAE
jgi:hypothetical protein